MKDKVKELIPEAEITKRIRELGEQISKEIGRAHV